MTQKITTAAIDPAAVAPSATTAANLAGGSAGTVPYQSAANTTVQLAAGTSGQFLKSNGAAAPSWANASSAAISYTQFTASGTWTKPTLPSGSTIGRVFIEAWGGGGGGSAGGGGGGGGYTFRWIDLSSLGSTETVTIGAGGAQDVSGSNTTFGSWLTAYGGGRGSPGLFPSGGGGGWNGAGAGGDAGSAGGTGQYSTPSSANGVNFDCGASGSSGATVGYNSYYGGGSGASGAAAATGGSSVYGGGGGAVGASAGGTSIFGGAGGKSGVAGTAPGGGGGTNGGTTGTAGGNGECRITVFVG